MNLPDRLANVSKRYCAAVIDSFVVVALFLIAKALPLPVLSAASPAVLFFLALLYEPVFTSGFCTLGQWLLGYRVRTLEQLERIGILQACWRYLLKIPLGVLSIFVISARWDHRALHDLGSNTIAVSTDVLKFHADAAT